MPLAAAALQTFGSSAGTLERTCTAVDGRMDAIVFLWKSDGPAVVVVYGPALDVVYALKRQGRTLYDLGG